MSSSDPGTVQRYDFLYESSVDDRGLSCASAAKPKNGNCFFQAKLWQPGLVGQLLLGLQRVVQWQFHQHRPPMRDPVVTSQSYLLGWEAFSGCYGVYCRVDLDERAFSELSQLPGTTNVDFNAQMIGQFARLGQHGEARLIVSREGIEFARHEGGRGYNVNLVAGELDRTMVHQGARMLWISSLTGAEKHRLWTTETWAQLTDDDRLDIPLLLDVLNEFQHQTWIVPRRWSEILSPVAKRFPLHAWDMAKLVLGMLTTFPFGAKDLAPSL